MGTAVTADSQHRLAGIDQPTADTYQRISECGPHTYRVSADIGQSCVLSLIDYVVTDMYSDYIGEAMVEVGVRELKARLSYYLQLAQAGEVIAVKVRNRVVSFLSKMRPSRDKPARGKRAVHFDSEQWIAHLKHEGKIVGGKRFRFHPFKPVRMTPGPTSTEMIRQMRDEE